MISCGLSVSARGLKWNKRLILRSIRAPSRGNCFTSRSSRPLPECIAEVPWRGNPQRLHHSISPTVVPLQYKWISPFSFGRWTFPDFAAILRNVMLCSLVEVHPTFLSKILPPSSRSKHKVSSRMFSACFVMFIWLASSNGDRMFVRNSGELAAAYTASHPASNPLVVHCNYLSPIPVTWKPD